MRKFKTQELLLCFDNAFETLCSLESVIKVTQDTCRDKEIYSIYYNLPKAEMSILSEERNHYINLLSIALDKLTSLKQISETIEKELINLK